MENEDVRDRCAENAATQYERGANHREGMK